MDYYGLLKKLLPAGAYSDDDASLVLKDIYVTALSLTRTQENAEALLDEMHPETAIYSLPDWERTCAIVPGQVDPVQTRQQRTSQKLRARGGLSRQYFIDLASTLGYTITVDEYEPFMTDIGCVGDSISAEEIFFVWLVTVVDSGVARVEFCTDGSSCVGDSLLWWPSSDYLEGIFNKLKRASTFVIFAYS